MWLNHTGTPHLCKRYLTVILPSAGPLSHPKLQRRRLSNSPECGNQDKVKHPYKYPIWHKMKSGFDLSLMLDTCVQETGRHQMKRVPFRHSNYRT